MRNETLRCRQCGKPITLLARVDPRTKEPRRFIDRPDLPHDADGLPALCGLCQYAESVKEG